MTDTQGSCRPPQALGTEAGGDALEGAAADAAVASDSLASTPLAPGSPREAARAFGGLNTAGGATTSGETAGEGGSSSRSAAARLEQQQQPGWGQGDEAEEEEEEEDWVQRWTSIRGVAAGSAAAGQQERSVSGRAEGDGRAREPAGAAAGAAATAGGTGGGFGGRSGQAAPAEQHAVAGQKERQPHVAASSSRSARPGRKDTCRVVG